MSNFSPDKIDTYFSNVELVTEGVPAWNKSYSTFTISDQYGNSAGTISYLGEQEWRIFVDNFPAPKRYFSTNLPIKSIEQFESDIARTGLHLIRV